MTPFDTGTTMHQAVSALLVATLALLAGCSGPSPSAAPTTAAATKGSIGVSLLTLDNPFFKVIGDTIAA